MSEWVFAHLSGAAVRRDPQETELFKTEDAGEGEYAGTDALVREVIQNSMDAGTGDGPVRVRFSLHENGSLPTAERIASYFGRLQPGLAYRDIYFDQSGVPQLPHGYLVCEDFGTRGLGGDPYRATDPPDGMKGEDFFWFWRNIGRSGKTGDDLGRWGLGKTVYRAASRVGCMLGMTVRQSDGKKLLMGQAVLRIHKHSGTECAPEGFWCRGCNERDTPLPIDDEAALAQFASEWNLARKDEPGLSVVVPYVADELKAESILRLAAVNFFVPIAQKHLVVEIAGDGLPGGQPEYRVDDQTIESVCKKLSWTGKARQKLNAAPPVEFAKKCFSPATEIVSTKLLGESRVPSMTEEAFDPGTLKQLRQKFADEELVAIRVPSALPKKTGGHEIGELHVYLQRTAVNDRFESYYVREGMTITRLNSKPSLRGTRALVTVDPGPLASLLGDTEGPSHVSWDTSNDERPNRVWKTWKGRVKFFAKIVDSLVELLTPPPEKADFDLLSNEREISVGYLLPGTGPSGAPHKRYPTLISRPILSDFFSIEQLESPQRKRKPKSDGERTRDFDPPEPSPRWYRMHGKEGGFQISDSNQLPTPVGAMLRVSVAYDMPSGNPMKHWSPFDFDFRKRNGAIKVKGKGISAGTKGGNVIEMKIEEEDFSLTASGFDIHRDLIVRIDEIQEEQEEADETQEVAL